MKYKNVLPRRFFLIVLVIIMLLFLGLVASSIITGEKQIVLAFTHNITNQNRTPKLGQAEISCHSLCACKPVPIYEETFFWETDVTNHPPMESCPAFSQTNSKCPGASLTVTHCQELPFGRKMGTPTGGLGSFYCVQQTLCGGKCSQTNLCGGEILPGVPISLADVRATVKADINSLRAYYRLPALVTDLQLEQSAQLHAQDMFTRNYFSHVNPEGQNELDRAIETGFSGSWVGDAMLAVYPVGEAEKIVDYGLRANPAHWGWILNPEVKLMGIGFMSPYIVVSFAIP